jgi:hypothetical protein
VEVLSHEFLTSAPDTGVWSAARPGRFTPGERAPGTHWIECFVGPTAGLYAVMKIKIPCPCRESNAGHPVCSLVTILTEPLSIPGITHKAYFPNAQIFIPAKLMLLMPHLRNIN